MDDEQSDFGFALEDIEWDFVGLELRHNTLDKLFPPDLVSYMYMELLRLESPQPPLSTTQVHSRTTYNGTSPLVNQASTRQSTRRTWKCQQRMPELVDEDSISSGRSRNEKSTCTSALFAGHGLQRDRVIHTLSRFSSTTFDCTSMITNYSIVRPLKVSSGNLDENEVR